MAGPQLSIAEAHYTKNFIVSSQQLVDLDPKTAQNQIILELKRLAVLDFLKTRLGSRLGDIEKLVTQQLAERFVLEYKVNRNSVDRNMIELEGQLDFTALRGWVTLEQLKSQGTWKPAYLLTSSVPGFTFGPQESSKRARETVIGQAVLAATTNVLRRIKLRFLLPSSWSSHLQTPPQDEVGIRNLRAQIVPSGLNAAIWSHLSECVGCGTRLDVLVYSLAEPPRLVWTTSEQIKLEQRHFGAKTRVVKAVQSALGGYSREFEDLLSSGILTSHPIRLTVRDMVTPRAYHNVYTALSELDFSNRCLLKTTSSKTAEFEILTQFSVQDFAQRLAAEPFVGFKLVPASSGESSLTVRFISQ